MTGTETDTTGSEALRAEYLRRVLSGELRGRRRGIDRADRTGPLRLSAGQRQMWFLNRLEPDSPEYLLPVVLRLRGELDVTALGTAWRRLHDRHEILRTRYALDGREPVQLVDPTGTPALPVDDLGRLPAEQREEAVRAHIARESQRPFDLEQEWPIRGRLLRRAPDDHVLIMVAHHIACDAWSTRLVAEELGEGYRRAIAESAGATAAADPAPALQYVDYAAWEHSRPTAEGLAYWREQLADLGTLDLPTDRRRPAVRGHRGDAAAGRLPVELADRVRVLAGAHGTTPFSVLLAAFQTLLARYTGGTDIPVGTVTNLRTRPELQGMIGYGINTLVLRGRLDGDPTFAELLRATHRTVLDAYDHQGVPFASLVAELEPERDRSRTPLFQTFLTLREQVVADYRLPGLAMAEAEPPRPQARFDLALVAEEAADGAFPLRLEYATELFDRATAERLLAHYVRLLDSAVGAPDTPLSALELLDPAERAELTAPPADRVEALRPLHELFAEQAARTPGAVAVVSGEHTLGYAELDGAADRLARGLAGLGVGPEKLVAVCLDRGADLLPALLGVLKAGGAYVPLDPTVPDARIAYVLGDTGARVLITQQAHVERLSALHDGELLVLDAPVEAEPAAVALPAVDPGQLAYVIHTSGSTGRPKGVAVTHRNVARLLATARRRLDFGAEDVWSLCHSYAFDVSVFEMWGALLHGGRLVVVDRETNRDPSDLLDLLVREQVTVLSQTPSAFRGLVAAAAAGDPRLARLALRAVVFAGERLDVPDLAPWVERFGPAGPRLVNMYGITETTVHATYREVGGADLSPQAGNPIGHPLDDLTLHLLDEHGRPVPTGARGEIHVGGAGVTRGYLGRPGLTAERFVPDPYGPPGARRYRSGDLARRLPDGSLEFLGRADDQVKVRGYRVEPGEVAVALAALASVREAAVVVREGRLVGYAVPSGERLPGAGELREELARTLPDYLVPSVFVALERLPLTANGKLDRRALPVPEIGLQQEYVAPSSAVEERVAEVWAQVLDLPRVGMTESFFDLGGDSIRAVALAGELRAQGFDAAVRDVFATRTVTGLAALLADRPTLSTALPEPAVEPYALIASADRERLPAGLADAYPMTMAQIGMAVDQLAEDRRSNYQNVATSRIRDERPFALPALRAAARVVVERHEVLRTSFDLESYSVPLQLVHAEATVPVVVRDLRGLSGEEFQERLREFQAAERAELFDLSCAPLLRLAVHLAEDGWWLSLTEFHGIVEGWSYHSLVRELLDCYRAFASGGEPAPYQRPATRYADAVAGELRALDSAQDREYWAEQVERYPAFALPAHWGSPDQPVEHYWESVPFDDLEDGLRALAAAAGASFKSVLVAAHGTVLSLLTDQDRFSSGVVVHTRPEAPGADRVYGMHLNTLPFGFERGARTWRELVSSVFEREVELWQHRRFPMPEVQRLAGAGRVVNVLLNHVDFERLESESIDLGSVMAPGTTEFDLAVTTLSKRISLKTSTRALSRVDAGRVAGLYRAVLEAMAADAEGDAEAVFLPSGESAVAEGLVGAEASGSGLVLERFAGWVERSPEAVAVVGGGVSLTFGEVDRLSTALAWRLRGLGVGAESVVGVLLGRGVELVVSLLAVWKAGAAYLPLDPSAPVERSGWMLADAGVRVVLTERGLSQGLSGVDVVFVGDGGFVADPSAQLPVVDPGQLAYVIYTSGSTGRPKGVQITHRALANHVAWAVTELAERGTGGAPLFSSHAFDLVVPNLWAPLASGQRLWLWPQERDLADLGADLSAAGPFSFVKLTPGHLEMLTHQLTDEQLAALAEVLVVAGEAFPGRLADRMTALLGSGRLINEYGPTEATVGTTIHPVPDGQGERVVPIGAPLPGMVVRVLDAGLRPVPLGALGELCVGGVGVARGYLGRPGLTAERFVPDPYGPPGARLYRTGDRAWIRPDGVVVYAGRVDDQVKVRGYRVEPGEVAVALAALASVREAAVVVREGRLVGYAVPSGERLPGAGELREELARTLPDYLVPSVFVALERLPLTANGKLDRRALPAPDAELHADFVAPGTPTEHALARVWAQVLDLPRVGMTESFFDLGGDSIRAVAVAGALRAQGFDVTVRDVFAGRTLAGLAALLEGRSTVVPEAAVAPFALLAEEDRAALPPGLADAYPVSQTQLGMVVEMFADETLHRYHGVASFRIRDAEPFRAPAFEAAARVVVERHEVLRTSFDLESYSVPLQLVHAEATVPVVVRDLRGLSGEEFQERLREFQAAERAELFDLSCAPLLRLAVHLAEDGWWFTMVRCHAITEGWSNYNLLMELLGCYRALAAGRDPEPPRPAQVRYADFVAGELRALDSAQDRGYWAEQVERYPAFALPAHWAQAPGRPSERYRLQVSFQDLEADLRALAARARASLKSVLLAAHLTVLSRLTDAPSFCTGLVCDARPEAVGADRVLGMYLNTLPFGFERGARTWRELVSSVFEREVELWPHRRFPMPEVQRLAGAGRLLNASFNYLDFPQVDRKLVDVGAVLADGNTEFDLAVTTVLGHVGLSSNTAVLSRVDAGRVAGLYRAVLEAMAVDAEGDAEAVFLPSGESAVAEGLVGAEAFGSGLVLERYAGWVERSPEAVAVVGGGVSLSFAELDGLSTALAWRLRGLGVGAESVVGVLLGRGVELVVSLLAVWKAGAAYLPLDPSAPVERAGWMLADAGVRVVLTERGLSQGLSGVDVVFVGDGGFVVDPSAELPVVDPGQLAYVIYTSGSTGRPKGVQITHGSFANRVAWAVDHHGIGRDDRVLLKTSIGFDAAGWEVFAPLAGGGTLVLAPDGAERDPEAMLRSVLTHRVTVLQAVPSVWHLLTELPDWPRCTSLRLLFSAGEPLTAALAGRMTAPGSRELWNTYGPTECTIDVTAQHLTADRLADPLPIGAPLPGTVVRVLDAGSRPVPLGTVGELCVGGVGVARGYLGRPGLTAERFVPDPYGPPGARLYRTGDRAWIRPDGVVVYAGRIDDQVKINGVRVEPGEAAAALAALDSVREAAVVVRDGRLIGYAVPRDGAPLRSAQLRRELAAELPPSLVPAVVIPLERLPLTHNGKLDRRALPDPEPVRDEDFVAPRTPTERALAEIYGRVLGLERVSARDAFFEHGGNSLLIIKVIAAATRQGLPVTLRMLYEYDTLADLAAAVDALTEGQDMTTHRPPTPAPAPEPAPAAAPAAETRIDEDALLEVMDRHGVPGVSLAILRDGEVVALEGYGVTAADRPEPVTARTPFQVASVSKHVTLLAVLQLVGDGTLNLDADLNRYLRSWQLPDGALVTLRELLSHQAGLSHVPPTNFLPTETMPTVLEVLTGTGPATNEPVRAQHPAGTVFRKTNINYSVLQQLLEDVTGRAFPELMRQLVLEPLEMTDSSFDQDFPHRSETPVAIGHDVHGEPIAGRYRVRNEVAAGGLWASAADLAKVATEIRRAYRGERGRLLTRPLAQQMLTIWHPGSFYGLGTVIDTSAGDLEFGHGGRTVGFRVGTFTQIDSGAGLIVLANSESGKQVQAHLADAIRRSGSAILGGELTKLWAQAQDLPVESREDGTVRGGTDD